MPEYTNADLQAAIAQSEANYAAYHVGQQSETVVPFENPAQVLRDMGLLRVDAAGNGYVSEEDRDNVTRFLNRVLALQVTPQNQLFDFYARLFEETVAFAKADGSYDEGVTDIKALSIRAAAPPRVVYSDPLTGAQTTHFKLDVELPTSTVTFDAALGLLEKHPDADFYRKRTTKKTRSERHYILASPSGRHTNPATGDSYRTFSVTKPSGARLYYMNEAELLSEYDLVDAEGTRDWWRKAQAALPTSVRREMHILSGAILALWERMKADRDAYLKVVRVTTDGGERVVGIEISRSRITAVLRQLGLQESYQKPDEIFAAVLEGGEEIELAGQMKLKRSRVVSEERIEVVTSDVNFYKELRRMGFVNEVIKHKQRFFVPVSPTRGVQLLEKLFARFPPLAPEVEEGATPPEAPETQVLGITPGTVFDLDELAEYNADLAPPQPEPAPPSPAADARDAPPATAAHAPAIEAPGADVRETPQLAPFHATYEQAVPSAPLPAPAPPKKKKPRPATPGQFDLFALASPDGANGDQSGAPR